MKAHRGAEFLCEVAHLRAAQQHVERPARAASLARDQALEHLFLFRSHLSIRQRLEAIADQLDGVGIRRRSARSRVLCDDDSEGAEQTSEGAAEEERASHRKPPVATHEISCGRAECTAARIVAQSTAGLTPPLIEEGVVRVCAREHRRPRVERLLARAGQKTRNSGGSCTAQMGTCFVCARPSSAGAPRIPISSTGAHRSHASRISPHSQGNRARTLATVIVALQ